MSDKQRPVCGPGDSSRVFVVTIDGPSGAGKSTTARAVADALGFDTLDSGALYRAVAVAALDAAVELEDDAALAELLARIEVRAEQGGRRMFVEGREVTARLRSDRVSQAASKVSALPSVRRALIDLQRDAVTPPGAVVEGRDMSTVVFPDAQVKVYLDADAGERAVRRTRELLERGEAVEAASVLAEMRQRDARDSGRENAPLSIAEGALVIDTTSLSPERVVEMIVAAIPNEFRAK